jgi:cysteine protease ATG4
MKKVEPEYLEVIRKFFACKVNVGILGGRPQEAYYLIGLQDGFLIFLDPHNT